MDNIEREIAGSLVAPTEGDLDQLAVLGEVGATSGGESLGGAVMGGMAMMMMVPFLMFIGTIVTIGGVVYYVTKKKK